MSTVFLVQMIAGKPKCAAAGIAQLLMQIQPPVREMWSISRTDKAKQATGRLNTATPTTLLAKIMLLSCGDINQSNFNSY
uniref:Bm8577, isoform b n=1 Tax=Brugia malayi TaxID=6279 RepID=A0A1I9G018_BRUMA|nr:Bm8577, isoform b [Brugia malayi]